MRHVYVVVVGLLLGACGSDDSGPDLAERCRTFNEAYVDRAVSCRMIYEGELVDRARGAKLLRESVPDCEARPGPIADGEDVDFAKLVSAIEEMPCADFCARTSEGCAE